MSVTGLGLCVSDYVAVRNGSLRALLDRRSETREFEKELAL